MTELDFSESDKFNQKSVTNGKRKGKTLGQDIGGGVLSQKTQETEQNVDLKEMKS